MRLIIAPILSLVLLSSCISITKTSYVDLKPKVSFSKNTKIGRGQRIKLNFSKIDSKGFPRNHKQLGYKMKESIFNNTKASTGIFSSKKLLDVIEDNFTKWLKVSNFKVVSEESFDKEVDIKLGYYSFQPFAYLPKIRSAIKITVNNSKKSKIFSKWYFYERKYEDTLSDENNENNINHSIKHLLENIFRDDNFIYKIQ